MSKKQADRIDELETKLGRALLTCKQRADELAAIKAQASDATEYVLAQINKDLRARLAQEEEAHAALQARCYDGGGSTSVFDEVVALRARLAEVERDAERYRWLRAPAKSTVSGAETSNLMLHALHGGLFRSNLGELDAAIDAARGGA